MDIKARLSRCIVRRSAEATTRIHRLLRSKVGQGTTEYAILVGVLVVIAVIAIAAFKGKIQDLWSAIQSGINGL